MRLWKTLVFTAFLSMACGDIGGMMGGGDDGKDKGDDQAEEDDGGDEDAGEDEEDEEEEVEEDEGPDRVRPTKECTPAALGAVAPGGKAASPKCAGRWASATLASGQKGLFEFDTEWHYRGGSCKGPTVRVCQTIGMQ